MSDYQGFCEIYGGCASDPDFMREWMLQFDNKKSTLSQQQKIKIFDFDSLKCQYNLTADEVNQIKKYMSIYGEKNFTSQKQANKYITYNNIWDEFPNIRSLNDHKEHKNVPGIIPKFYKITCDVLRLLKGDGNKLTKFTRY